MTRGSHPRPRLSFRKIGSFLACVLFLLTGCQPSVDLPAADAAASPAAAGIAVDLAQWPFGRLERRYRPAERQPASGPRFLEKTVTEGFNVPDSWAGPLRSVAGPPSLDQLSTVNDLVNGIPYSRVDNTVWKSPRRFLLEGGGCNCYAIMKYVLLRRMGHAANDLRITVVRRRNATRTHSILVVRLGSGRFETFLLDNVGAHVRTALYANDYRPLASVNETGVWVHDETGVDVAGYLANPPLVER